MHVWISQVGAPVPALSTAAQVTGSTFTWLTRFPLFNDTPPALNCEGGKRTKSIKMCSKAPYSVSVFVWRSGGRPEASQVGFGAKLA